MEQGHLRLFLSIVFATAQILIEKKEGREWQEITNYLNNEPVSSTEPRHGPRPLATTNLLRPLKPCVRSPFSLRSMHLCLVCCLLCHWYCLTPTRFCPNG